jgi:hypothetical protein
LRRLKNKDGDTAYKLAQEVKFPSILEFFSILSSDKNPMNPENRAKVRMPLRSPSSAVGTAVARSRLSPSFGVIPLPLPISG